MKSKSKSQILISKILFMHNWLANLIILFFD